MIGVHHVDVVYWMCVNRLMGSHVNVVKCDCHDKSIVKASLLDSKKSG